MEVRGGGLGQADLPQGKYLLVRITQKDGQALQKV